MKLSEIVFLETCVIRRKMAGNTFTVRADNLPFFFKSQVLSCVQFSENEECELIMKLGFPSLRMLNRFVMSNYFKWILCVLEKRKREFVR